MRSKFSSQENLCLQSLGSQGSHRFCTLAGQERPIAAVDLEPFCRSWTHQKPFLDLSQPEESDSQGIACLPNFLSLAEQIIPPLRTTHRVAIAASVETHLDYEPRGGRPDRQDRRQPRDPSSYENRSRVIDDAFRAPLDSVKTNSMVFAQ